ncbi:MAG: MFS transporter [Holophagales bacterium]|jgi:AAA family ATP:ADP antiporter|nr:MFS transporter [Holophagales bacterium]
MTPPSGLPWLKRLFPLRPGEDRKALLSALYFFLLLMSYYLLRPLRETFGISRGADKLPLVWSCTLGVMALANPLYSALISRRPRRKFIPWTYFAFAAMLLAFGLFFQWLPGHGGAALGYTFYVWLSVFNLFVVSIFWAFMSDLYSREDGQRLYGFIAIGGTCGAIVGSWTTGLFSQWLGQGQSQWLFYASAAILGLAVICVAALFRNENKISSQNNQVPKEPMIADASREPGPGVMAGFSLIGRSRLLQSMSLYILLYAVVGTFLYIIQARVIEGAFADNSARTAAFAKLDMWANILTLAAQLCLTHRLVARVGIAVSLVILPIVTILGFGALMLWPGFTALAIFQVARRGMHYAVDRPVREMLYIPLAPDAKYKAKSFIDTFVYRAGDLMGVWLDPLLRAISMSLGLPSLGISALWLGGAVWLGRLSGGKEEK